MSGDGWSFSKLFCCHPARFARLTRRAQGVCASIESPCPPPSLPPLSADKALPQPTGCSVSQVRGWDQADRYASYDARPGKGERVQPQKLRSRVKYGCTKLEELGPSRTSVQSQIKCTQQKARKGAQSSTTRSYTCRRSREGMENACTLGSGGCAAPGNRMVAGLRTQTQTQTRLGRDGGNRRESMKREEEGEGAGAHARQGGGFVAR